VMTSTVKETRRTLGWLKFIGAIIIALFLAVQVLGSLKHHILAFEFLFSALFLAYLAALFLVWRADLPERQSLAIVVVVAILIRLLMLFSAPSLSIDIYRYAWDGKVQVNGYDPYFHSPADNALSALRDNQAYGHLSRIFIHKPAVYPPGAEMFFRAGALSKSNVIWVIKLLLTLADIGSIWLLVLILRRLRVNPVRAVIYAWSPLVVIEICQSGHIDGLMVLFVLAAILAALKGKDFAAGGWTALAVATKLFPCVFLPALYRRRDWKLPVSFAIGLTLIFLPYWRAVSTLFGLTAQMQYQPKFNSALLLVFQGIFGDSSVVHTVYVIGVVATIAVAGLIVWWRQDGSDERMMQGLFLMAALLLVLLPFLQPWYLVLIIPLLAWRPSPAFLYISGAAMLSYLINSPQAGVSTVAGLFEFIPFFLLLAAEIGLSVSKSHHQRG
jgi:alpha-1,6-mannosyltransferase